jgi:hypothetical protein
MNKAHRLKAQIHRAVAAKSLLLLAALLGAWASPSQAAQVSAPFTVTINLQTNNDIPKNAGLCRSASMIGTFGATITVVCSTGAIANISGDSGILPSTTKQDDSYRFLTQISKAGELLGTVDSYTGGAVTSWRMVSLANRNYLEMMVHW